jgi:hypothetical protein
MKNLALVEWVSTSFVNNRKEPGDYTNPLVYFLFFIGGIIFMFESNMTYHVFKDYNIIFDEKGATCGTVRKVQWVKEGKEPDESKAKIEIRKMYVNSNGERTGKGFSFATDEGPGELAVGLIKAGFGETKEILRVVRKRKDFLEAAKTIDQDQEESDGSGEIFDMRELLLGLDSEEDDYAE